MSILKRDQLTELISHQDDTCVSFFMPTHKSGRERRQNPIRLKNLLAEAREQLTAQGLSEGEAKTLLQPVEVLRNDEAFWSHCQDGLALFTAKDFFRTYQVPLILEPSIRVHNRFHIRPLIELLHGDARFFVLAISQETASLFEATRYSIRELDLQAVLATVSQAAVGHDEEQALQFRTFSNSAEGRGNAIYHGHGGAADVSKQDILKTFQAVDRAVVEMLRGQDAPLVLACVGYLAPIYETANSYAGLIQGKVPGSPAIWDENELRDRAWELASPILNQGRDQARKRLEDVSGTDKAATDLHAVVLAASDGRVDSLFLEKNRTCWGNVDPKLRAVQVLDESNNKERGKGAEDLLDFAAAHTLMHGGTVFSYEANDAPVESAPAAALLRYGSS